MDEIFEILVSNLATESMKAAIFTIAVTALVGFVRFALTGKPKIVWAISHRAMFRIRNANAPMGEIPIRTQTVFFQNVGRNEAEDVEILLNHDVEHYEFWQPVEHNKTLLDDGRIVLKINRLRARESYTINFFDSTAQLPNVLSVKWKNGIGRQVEMTPMRVFPKFVYVILVLLLVAGILGSVFVAVRILQWLFS